jgi:endogenous inhibitor of DNA gyrase (YacG/DUF329 family)
MAASAWHALVLLEFKDRFPGFDDRYDPADDDAKYAEMMEERLHQFVAHEQAEPGQPPGDDWETLGWISEDTWNQAKSDEELPSEPVEIDWKDPALPTASKRQEMIDLALAQWCAERYVVPVRFVAGLDGTSEVPSKQLWGSFTSTRWVKDYAECGIGLLRKHRPFIQSDIAAPRIDPAYAVDLRGAAPAPGRRRATTGLTMSARPTKVDPNSR